MRLCPEVSGMNGKKTTDEADLDGITCQGSWRENGEESVDGAVVIERILQVQCS